MPKTTTTKLISIKDFAAEYGVGVTQAYAAAKKGEIPALRIGRRLWIVRDILEEELKAIERFFFEKLGMAPSAPEPARGLAEKEDSKR